MRVLTVGNLYPPHHFGGYEQVWASAVAHLREQGHEVAVLATGYRHPGVPDGAEPGVHRVLRWYWRDHEFADLRPRARVATERHNHAALAAAIAQLGPEIVSFWSMGGMSHSLIEAVRRRRLPMVAFVHDQWLDYGRHTDQWLRLFYGRKGVAAPLAERVAGVPARIDYGAAGRYVFVSEFIRARALALHPGLRDTAVAHSGIDPRFLQAQPRPEWRWRLLHVGRLHPDKGIHHAVAALARLPDAATLTFAGTWDPRDEDALTAAIARRGVADRVTLLGQRPPDEVARLYREHDALLFPVVWDEPWGLVPLEAMGSGCPVVATGLGGSGEYLRDGENALLVPPADPEALATAITRLAGDGALRERLRAGGLATAPRHTDAIFNAQVEEHLRGYLAAR